MASKVISLRVEQRLYDEFVEKLKKEDSPFQDKINEWIRAYVSTEGEYTLGMKVTEFTPPFEKFLGWIKKTLGDEVFVPGSSAEDFYRGEMNFSWMFSGAELGQYMQASTRSEISSSGWFLKLWLWTTVWIWISYEGKKHPLETTGLVEEWSRGKSPVDVVIEKLTEVGESAVMESLLSDYYDDPEGFW